MTFYARLQATANRLLKGKGQSITLTKITAGTYNPATGGFTGAGTSTQTAYGAVFDYSNENIDGVLVLKGDKRLLLSAFTATGATLTAPVVNDTVTIGGVVHTVTNIITLSPSGKVVLYELNLRQ